MFHNILGVGKSPPKDLFKQLKPFSGGEHKVFIEYWLFSKTKKWDFTFSLTHRLNLVFQSVRAIIDYKTAKDIPQVWLLMFELVIKYNFISWLLRLTLVCLN